MDSTTLPIILLLRHTYKRALDFIIILCDIYGMDA